MTKRRRPQVPTINALSIDLSDRDLSFFEVWLSESVTHKSKHAPMARDHAHIASLVQQSSGPVIFRIEDDPRILCVWQHRGTVAIVFTLWRRTLRCIDMIFVGDSTDIAPEWAEILEDTEISEINQKDRPLLVMCSVRNGWSPLPGILGMIAYMPVMCDLHGID
jgi:hypothetical protein